MGWRVPSACPKRRGDRTTAKERISWRVGAKIILKCVSFTGEVGASRRICLWMHLVGSGKVNFGRNRNRRALQRVAVRLRWVIKRIVVLLITQLGVVISFGSWMFYLVIKGKKFFEAIKFYLMRVLFYVTVTQRGVKLKYCNWNGFDTSA